MTRIMFVQPLFTEQIGVMTLAAIARAKGHPVTSAVGSSKHILRKAADFKPDIVAFSVMTGYQKGYLKLSRALRERLEPRPLIVFGGPHPTFFPEIGLEPEVDLACRGEGEGALAEILDAVEGGGGFEGIDNLVFQRDGRLVKNPLRPLVDLDQIPFPDREIYDDYPFIARAPNVCFAAGRGCPYQCTFCFNRRMQEMVRGLGPYVRYRSVEGLLEEIDRVQKRRKIGQIQFMDDTFVADPKWLFSFLEAYGSRFSIPFYCNVRADQLTREMALALKGAGCRFVSFGVESGVERLRNQVLKKRIRDDQIRSTAAYLQEAGIPFNTTNMMGLPGESLEEALRTLELNLEIGAETAWTSVYQPFPGTDLAEYCLEQGLIDLAITSEDVVDTHTLSLLKQPQIEEVVRLQKFVHLVKRFPWTLGLVRRLIRYDHPTIYKYIHRTSYLLFYYRKALGMSWWRTFKEGLVAWLHYR